LEGEVFVGDTVVERFRSVDGCVDLEEVQTWEVSSWGRMFFEATEEDVDGERIS
jgi:hypothetical protein